MIAKLKYNKEYVSIQEKSGVFGEIIPNYSASPGHFPKKMTFFVTFSLFFVTFFKKPLQLLIICGKMYDVIYCTFLYAQNER